MSSGGANLTMRLAVPIALLPLLVVPQGWAASDARSWLFGFLLYALALGAWWLLSRLPPDRLRGGALGVTTGLLIAYLLTPVVKALAVAPFEMGDSNPGRAILTVALYLTVSVLGAAFGAALSASAASPQAARPATASSLASMVCDTSVLIDGRIVEMAEAGFLAGELVIPQFILRELQGIADSGEPLKRNRGRRGLSVVEQLQKVSGLKVSIPAEDVPEEREVDHKLLRLAADRGAALITNDYNLNKVARVRGLKVLNLNDLVNALKPIHLPGEELILSVSRAGKEAGQGVGYLDDGTMIVIDGGATHVGKTVRVVVTNIHQTTAGRMIFTRFESVTGKARGESADKS